MNIDGERCKRLFFDVLSRDVRAFGTLQELVWCFGDEGTRTPEDFVKMERFLSALDEAGLEIRKKQ